MLDMLTKDCRQRKRKEKKRLAAEVHGATLLDGRKVAVKVERQLC